MRKHTLFPVLEILESEGIASKDRNYWIIKCWNPHILAKASTVLFANTEIPKHTIEDILNVNMA